MIERAVDECASHLRVRTTDTIDDSDDVLAVMSSLSVAEQAFKRHSRPQQTTLPATGPAIAKPRTLNAQSSRSWAPPSLPPLPPIRKAPTAPREANVLATSNWGEFVQLGLLIQGDTEMLVCTGRQQRSKLFMFKEISHERDISRQACLSFRHPNILSFQHIVESNTDAHLVSDFVRCTLGEVLSVHVPLQECHISCIAKAVCRLPTDVFVRHADLLEIFEAIKYLNQQGYVHGRINSNTIRLCARTGRVFLSDCDECTRAEGEPNTDLEDLGLVILDCMEASGERQVRTAAEVQKQRSTNKVFGLSNPERWSGSKKLIDFLDDLFSPQRRPADKLSKVHEYVNQKTDDLEVLYPLIQLASLECVAVWQVVQ